MRRVLLIVSLCIVHCALCIAQVGTWRAYMAYHEPQQIVKAGDALFVRASNSLYQYNLTDQSITTYDKITGLSDSYITHIGWNQQAKRLIIVYQNSNIDLMDNAGNVTNISALYRKTMTDDKTIDSLTIDGVYAYLYARFGIVKVNMQRAEISDTYRPGSHEYPSTLPYSTVNKDWSQYIHIVKMLKPGGPKRNLFLFMKFANNRLYTCTGGTTDVVWKANIQILQNGEWTIYEDDVTDRTHRQYENITCLDYDPKDPDHVFAGARNGLYEYKDGKFVNFWNADNSPICPFNDTDQEYQMITGVKFDTDGQLWLINSQARDHDIMKYANGSFSTYQHPELQKLEKNGINRTNSNLSNMFIDSQGLMWFVNYNWRLPALYSYNTETNTVKAYESFTNQDGTMINVSGYVSCVTEDLNQNIWIGTNAGPLMLERSQLSSSNSVFTQVKVPRNDGTDYADYLMAGVDVISMAIDGGGRKWFGTNGSGVYLISSDNMQQLQHFTTANSPLLSDAVRSIAINDATGEVFFGTENGLCSFVSDATQTATEMTKDNVYAYPNPVTPDYNGLITIVGLTLNADVKITSSSGKVIAQGRSNGGTFIWDGNDSSGKRVASGVYMVVTATSNGEKGTVCKIAIVK